MAKNHNNQGKPKLTDAVRHKRFVDTAKKAEASETMEEFDRAFAKIVTPTREVTRSSKTSQR